MERYRIGPLTIAEMGKDPIQLEGETTSGAQAVGFAKIYEVHSDEDPTFSWLEYGGRLAKKIFAPMARFMAE